jgi:hypothetical protein
VPPFQGSLWGSLVGPGMPPDPALDSTLPDSLNRDGGTGVQRSKQLHRARQGQQQSQTQNVGDSPDSALPIASS